MGELSRVNGCDRRSEKRETDVGVRRCAYYFIARSDTSNVRVKCGGKRLDSDWVSSRSTRWPHDVDVDDAVGPARGGRVLIATVAPVCLSVCLSSGTSTFTTSGVGVCIATVCLSVCLSVCLPITVKY